MNSIFRLEVSSLLNQFVREWETRTCLNYNIARIRLVNNTKSNPLKMEQRIPSASKPNQLSMICILYPLECILNISAVTSSLLHQEANMEVLSSWFRTFLSTSTLGCSVPPLISSYLMYVSCTHSIAWQTYLECIGWCCPQVARRSLVWKKKTKKEKRETWGLVFFPQAETLSKNSWLLLSWPAANAQPA